MEHLDSHKDCSRTSLNGWVRIVLVHPDPLLGTEENLENEANPHSGGYSLVGEIKNTDGNFKTVADEVEM